MFTENRRCALRHVAACVVLIFSTAAQAQKMPTANDAANGVESVAEKPSRSLRGVVDILQAHVKDIYKVYNHALREDPSLKGKIAFELTIAPSGKVMAARVSASEMLKPSFEQEMLLTLQSFEFGAQDVRTLVTTYPIDFVPTVSQPSQREEDCNPDRVTLTILPGDLRRLAQRCSGDATTFALAVGKLNDLPPSAVPRLRLHSPVDESMSQRVTLQVDVFFNFLEAYPPDAAFEKLNDLLTRMSSGFAVERLYIVASSDKYEHDGLASFEVSKRRAAFLKQYFSAAGIDPSSMTVSERGPIQADTAEGRARDRVGQVKAVFQRERTQYRSRGKAGAEPNGSLASRQTVTSLSAWWFDSCEWW